MLTARVEVQIVTSRLRSGREAARDKGRGTRSKVGLEQRQGPGEKKSRKDKDEKEGGRGMKGEKSKGE
jgi:hypothetical protein